MYVSSSIREPLTDSCYLPTVNANTFDLLVFKYLFPSSVAMLTCTCKSLYDRCQNLQSTIRNGRHQSTVWFNLFNRDFSYTSEKAHDVFFELAAPRNLSDLEMRLTQAQFYRTRTLLQPEVITSLVRENFASHQQVISLPNGAFAEIVNKRVFVWDKDLNQTLHSHPVAIRCLSLLVDGRLAIGANDATIRLRHLHDTAGAQDVTLTAHTEAITCLATVSQKRMVSGSADHQVRLWDLDTQQSLVIASHKSAITCLTMLPKGAIASGSHDPVICVNAGNTLYRLKGHTAAVTCMTVTQQGMLVSGSEDGTILIWNWKVGARTSSQKVLKSLLYVPLSLTICHQGLIWSGGRDGEVRVWDFTNVRHSLYCFEQDSFDSRGAINSMTALTDGRVVVTDTNGSYAIVDVSPQHLVERAIKRAKDPRRGYRQNTFTGVLAEEFPEIKNVGKLIANPFKSLPVTIPLELVNLVDRWGRDLNISLGSLYERESLLAGYPEGYIQRFKQRFRPLSLM